MLLSSHAGDYVVVSTLAVACCRIMLVMALLNLDSYGTTEAMLVIT
jgi:hypothetical protein